MFTQVQITINHRYQVHDLLSSVVSAAVILRNKLGVRMCSAFKHSNCVSKVPQAAGRQSSVWFCQVCHGSTLRISAGGLSSSTAYRGNLYAWLPGTTMLAKAPWKDWSTGTKGLGMWYLSKTSMGLHTS